VVTAYFEHLFRVDVRDAVSLVSCPTLVLHFEHAPIPVAQGRWLADHIADARFELLPGNQSQYFTERQERMIGLIEEFLTGLRRGADPDRVLATVLFTTSSVRQIEVLLSAISGGASCLITTMRRSVATYSASADASSS